MDTGLLHQLIEVKPHHLLFIQNDEGLTLQFLEAHFRERGLEGVALFRAFREPVPLGDRKQNLFPLHLEPGETGALQRTREKRAVHFAVGHRFRQLPRREFPDLDPDPRGLTPERGEDVSQHRDCPVLRRPDHDFPGFHIPPVLVIVLPLFLNRVDPAFRLNEILPFLSECPGRLRAVKNRAAECVLEPLHVLRKRGLRHEEPPRRASDRTAFQNRFNMHQSSAHGAFSIELTFMFILTVRNNIRLYRVIYVVFISVLPE